MAEDLRLRYAGVETIAELIDLIDAEAQEIRNDWSDPRENTREIRRLCAELRARLHLTSMFEEANDG